MHDGDGMGVPRAQRAGFFGARERSERGGLAPQAKYLSYMCTWMLMTIIWHNIRSTKRFNAHVLLRLMGDFVCSNGRGD
eukprot:1403002-Prymnesium_polylepis.1